MEKIEGVTKSQLVSKVVGETGHAKPGEATLRDIKKTIESLTINRKDPAYNLISEIKSLLEQAPSQAPQEAAFLNTYFDINMATEGNIHGESGVKELLEALGVTLNFRIFYPAEERREPRILVPENVREYTRPAEVSEIDFIRQTLQELKGGQEIFWLISPDAYKRTLICRTKYHGFYLILSGNALVPNVVDVEQKNRFGEEAVYFPQEYGQQVAKEKGARSFDVQKEDKKLVGISYKDLKLPDSILNVSFLVLP